jgi:CRISPR-associated protein Csy2
MPWPDVQVDRRKAFARLRRRLLPGFALIHRPDLLRERLTDAGMRRQHQCARRPARPDPPQPPPVPHQDGTDPDTGKVEWQLDKRPGWLVPCPSATPASRPCTPRRSGERPRRHHPFRFVESLYSLGQWIGPHRLGQLDQLLWHGTAEPATGLYRCENRYADLIETEPNPHQGA